MTNEGNARVLAFSTHDTESAEGWAAHPKCPGVSLKHLIRGTDSGGCCSWSLVRIDPGCEITPHRHEGRSEVHHVLKGSGTCEMSEKVAYVEGTTAHIPADAEHRVVAGKDGLLLAALFAPSLF